MQQNTEQQIVFMGVQKLKRLGLVPRVSMKNSGLDAIFSRNRHPDRIL